MHRKGIAPTLYLVAYLAAVILLGLYLRYDGVSRQVLCGDEVHAVHVARTHSFWECFTHYREADNSIPLTLYAKGLMETVGLSELRFRLPVMAADLLLLLCPLLFLRRLGRTVVLAAVTLLAATPLAVYYAAVARPYTPAALFLFLAVFGWDRWMESRSAGAFLCFTCCAALAGFFHLFCLIPVGGLFLLALLGVRTGSVTVRSFAAALALTAVLILLLLGPGFPDLWATRTGKLGETAFSFASLRWAYELLTGLLAFPALALLFLMGVGTVLFFRRDRLLGRALLLLFLLQCLALCLARPKGGDPGQVAWARYLFLVWPPSLLLAAAGLAVCVRFVLKPWMPSAGQGEGRIFPIAVTASSLVLALAVPFFSPMALFRDHPTSFRTRTAVLRPVPLKGLPLPEVYRTILNDPDPGTVLIEHPAHEKGAALAAYAAFQREHGLHVLMASEGVQAVRDQGVRYRNVLDLENEEELEQSGAKYLVVRPAACSKKTRKALAERFGPPSGAGGKIELYRLRGR